MGNFVAAPNIMTPEAVQGPLEVGATKIDMDIQEPQGPALEDVIDAGFKRENVFSSADLDMAFQADLDRAKTNPADDEFNVVDHIPPHLQESQYIDAFVQYADNPEQAEIVRGHIENELELNRTLDESGWLGVVGRIAGSITNPTTLVPIIPAAHLLKFGKMGILKRAAIGSTSVGGAIAVEEVLLQESQLARTREESEIAVAAGLFLGGAFGWLMGRGMPADAIEDVAADLRHHMGDRTESPKFEIKEGSIKMMPENYKAKFSRMDCP